MAGADKAVLDIVANKFMNSDRIDSLLRGLSETLMASSHHISKQIGNLKGKRTKITSSLNVLYDAIGEGQLDLDDVLRGALSSKKSQIQFLTEQIGDLEQQLSPTFKSHGPKHTAAFCSAFEEVLLSGDTQATKAYLCSVISEIRVDQRKIEVTGKRLQLAAAVAEWTPNTKLPSVPSVVAKWRAWHDSNERPPGS